MISVFAQKKTVRVYCNSYMRQNLRMRCSLNFEFGTFDAMKCIFIFFHVNKETQQGDLGPPRSNSVVVLIRPLINN